MCQLALTMLPSCLLKYQSKYCKGSFQIWLTFKLVDTGLYQIILGLNQIISHNVGRLIQSAEGFKRKYCNTEKNEILSLDVQTSNCNINSCWNFELPVPIVTSVPTINLSSLIDFVFLEYCNTNQEQLKKMWHKQHTIYFLSVHFLHKPYLSLH